jgi:hypothetical protein
MAKIKKIIYSLTLIPLIIILILFGWFFTVVFEGEKPAISLSPLPEFLSRGQKFSLKVTDKKRGLRTVKVTINQEGREVHVLEEKFPFRGLMNREGIHLYEKQFSIDPSALNLAQGRVSFNVRVWDYSRRGGGDGNLALIEHKITVDTIPPAIRAVSRMHNVNKGGAGLVVYQASSDTQESGLFVNDRFFPGYPLRGNDKKGLHTCYFAIPHDADTKASIHLWAKDRADNISKSGFYFHIRNRRFRSEKMNITDRFLTKVLPYFSFFPLESQGTDLEKYIKINNDLRKENHLAFQDLTRNTDPERLWEGPFLRLKNAATMARFADRRLYYYGGQKVDEQTHLGIDLASLANSPVQAANNGRVLFAGRLGIYGSTVVLDHGQGLTSVYGHLSNIEVTRDQMVKRGEIVGLTGQTGLAGGDHLHFSIMINGVFVNPVEWWDGHWIEDNINRKLALLR